MTHTHDCIRQNDNVRPFRLSSSANQESVFSLSMQGDRSSVMTGVSMDSKIDSTKSRISLGTLDSSVAKKRSTTADEIFDKEFKENKKKNEPTKSK